MNQHIEWLDADGTPLFSLYRAEFDPNTGQWTPGYGSRGVTQHNLPEIKPDGTVQDVPGTSAAVYIGSDHLRAGDYVTEVSAFGPTRLNLTETQREITDAARRTRWVRWLGHDLPISRFSGITNTQYAHVTQGALTKVTFRPALPYWLQPEQEVSLAGGVTDLEVPGEASVPLRVTLTTQADVVDPAIVTDAGRTRWLGTLKVGETLVIDGTPGVWTVTLNGVDVSRYLTGPQPALNPGTTRAELRGIGLRGKLAFRAGVLLPVTSAPDVGTENAVLSAQEW